MLLLIVKWHKSKRANFWVYGKLTYLREVWLQMANNPLDFDKLVKSYGESFPMVQIIDKEVGILEKYQQPEVINQAKYE